MKVVLLSLVFFVVLNTEAQTTTKTRKVIPILTEQTFYLNGGVRSAFGGKSRTFYQIDLPQNTIEWYYVFTTSAGQGSSTALSLIPQLTKALSLTGVAGILATSILSPTGSNTCDIYVMDRKNADAFQSKVDLTGGTYYYNVSGSRENFKNGTVQINNLLTGTHYIGVKNPSSSTGINVKLEVAAIVEETIIDNSIWTVPTKERFSILFYNNLIEKKVSNEIARDISNCMIGKISSEKTPETYDQMTRSEKESYFQNLMTQCSEKYKIKKTPEQEKAITYGNLGWKAYEEGDIDKCIIYSKKALTLDSTLGYVKGNLGLCYLVKNDEAMATDYYIDALTDFKRDNKTKKENIEAVIKDIDETLKRNSLLKGVSTIRSLFLSELKN